MAEDKINMYYPVYSLTGNYWLVLSDGSKSIIVKPKDVVLVNSERGMYSIILPKSSKGTHKRVHCIIIEREDVKVVYEHYDKIF
jgi:hypothetical protein